MAFDNVTQTLAIWGAVTGTIGTIAGIANLVIRIKEHKNDQPKLVCTSDFSFEHSNGFVKPKYKLILRSVGKRPVTVDFIKYCIKPENFWPKIFKKNAWAKNRWIYKKKLKNNLHITEGKKEDVRIALPNGLEIIDILRVEIHDQAGKAWLVKWPRHKKLSKLIHHEQLHESIESNNDHELKIRGYKASATYYLFVQWNRAPKNMHSFASSLFSFKDIVEYHDKLKNVVEVQQPKLLALEISSIE